MKRIISLVVAAGLVFSLVLTGCASKAKPDQGEAKGSTQTENTQTQVEKTSSGTKLTWDSPDISWKKKTTPVTLDIFVDQTWYPMESFGNDDVSKEIIKRTGVTLNYTKATDPNQLQVMVAGNELPDLVFASGNNSILLQTDKTSYPFDELINQYAPELMYMVNPVEISNNLKDDKHFYTLKTHYASPDDWKKPNTVPSPGNAWFFYRQDIVQALGNPPMDSYENVEAVFKQVKEKYPEMTIYGGDGRSWDSFMEFMGLGKRNYLKDGKVYNWTQDARWLDYFKFVNRLYREGLISAETFTYPYDQFLQFVNKGNIFAAVGASTLADQLNATYDANNIKGHMVPVSEPLKWNGKIAYAPIADSVGWASLFITNNCKNPERAILLYEFLKSPEGSRLTQWGIEGKHYQLNKDGLVEMLGKYKNFSLNDNDMIRETGIPYWYFGANAENESIFLVSGKINSPKYSTVIDALLTAKKYFQIEPALYFAKPDAGTDDFNTQTKIDQLFTTTYWKIITADSEEKAVELYNTMMDGIKKLGVDKLDEDYTSSYQKAQWRYQN